jgi:hypothetical protein
MHNFIAGVMNSAFLTFELQSEASSRANNPQTHGIHYAHKPSKISVLDIIVPDTRYTSTERIKNSFQVGCIIYASL